VYLSSSAGNRIAVKNHVGIHAKNIVLQEGVLEDVIQLHRVIVACRREASAKRPSDPVQPFAPLDFNYLAVEHALATSIRNPAPHSPSRRHLAARGASGALLRHSFSALPATTKLLLTCRPKNWRRRHRRLWLHVNGYVPLLMWLRHDLQRLLAANARPLES